MSYAQKIIDKQSGQTSQLSSEKNPLGTYARLLDVRSKNGELEFIGAVSNKLKLITLSVSEIPSSLKAGSLFFM